MARARRVGFAGGIYHVMCRRNARQRVFLDNRDDARFINGLSRTLQRCGGWGRPKAAPKAEQAGVSLRSAPGTRCKYIDAIQKRPHENEKRGLTPSGVVVPLQPRIPRGELPAEKGKVSKNLG